MDKCVICGGKIVKTCKCARSDKWCENGHEFHWSPFHQEYHEGISDHSKDANNEDCCVEKKVVKVTMKYKEAEKHLTDGKTIARKSWKGGGYGPFLFYLSHSDLCSAFGYGYGEYIGEPSFESTIVVKTDRNTLRMGWEPNKEDKEADDWIVTGTWTKKDGAK